MSEYEAGRELDKLIAEKVMGLPNIEMMHLTYDPECGGPSDFYPSSVPLGRISFYETDDYCWRTDEERQRDQARTQEVNAPQADGIWRDPIMLAVDAHLVPRYSTDMDAAWEVVERLNLLDRHALYFDSLSTHEWEVDPIQVLNFEDVSEIDCLVDIVATAPTPALAICRAALKIVEAGAE